MRAMTAISPAESTGPFSLARPIYRARAQLAIDAVCAVYPIDPDGLARAGDTVRAREARAVAATLLSTDVGLCDRAVAEVLGVTARVLATAMAWLRSYLAMEPLSPTQALRQREIRANIARARAAYERSDRSARKKAVREHTTDPAHTGSAPLSASNTAIPRRPTKGPRALDREE